MRVEENMAFDGQPASVSKGALWGGRVIGWVIALFLLLDAVAKLFKPAAVVEGTVRLGYHESVIVPLGIVLLVCTILYLIPITSALGAILLTGYLGGAVATHVRAGEPVFNVIFAIAFGVLLWLSLYLTDVRLRALVPLRSARLS
jgi:hypothetical protein